MKKLSLVLVLAMLFSFTASAALLDEGTDAAATWAIEEGWTAETTTGDKVATKKVNVTTSYAGAGSSSLYMYYGPTDGFAYAGAGYAYAYTDALTLEEGKTYTVTYLAKRHWQMDGVSFAASPGYVQEDGTFKKVKEMYIGSTGAGVTNSNGLTHVSGTGDTWWAMSYDLDYTAAAYPTGARVGFTLRNGDWSAEGWACVDNVVVTEKGTNNVVFADGFGEDVLTPAAEVDNGWYTFITAGGSGTATVTAELVDSTKNVYNGTTNLGTAVLDGSSALYMSYAAPEFGYSTYGNHYVYTDPIDFVDGKTYDISMLVKAGDTAYNLKFMVGKVDGINKTVTNASGDKWYHGSDVTKVSTGVSYVDKASISFTYDADTMGSGLSFIICMRGTGWSANTQEASFDSLRIIESGDVTQTNLADNANPGFGTDTVEKEPVSRAWEVGEGWNAMYVKNTKFTTTTAEILGADAVVSSEIVSTRVAGEGEKGLKVTYAQGVAGQFGTYGHNYTYSPVLSLENGKTYTVSGIWAPMNTADYATALGIGAFDASAITASMKVTNWTNTISTSDYIDDGKIWRKFSFNFTYDEAWGDVSFAVYQRACGYSYDAEVAIDNIVIREDGTYNYPLIEGFGDDVVEVEKADPVVTLGTSSDLGEYTLNYAADGVADGKATYSVTITTVPFGRKAVITANGEAIAADIEYEVTEDTEIVVTWEDDGTDVLNGLATAYEAAGEAAVFAKFNGTMPENYGFIIDAFVGAKFDIGGVEYEAVDGKLPATGNTDGVFGIKIAGIEAGTYSAVPYAGEATADAIAFNIQ